MSKYRVKLNDGRIVGPFGKQEIKELVKKKRISLADEFQKFPVGDWLKGSQIDEVSELFSEDSIDNQQTFIRKLSEIQVETLHPSSNNELQLNKAEGIFPQEFQFKIQDTAEGASRTSRKETPDYVEREESDEESEEEKTDLHKKTINKRVQSTDRHDQTLISSDTLKYLEELKEQKKKEELEKKEKIEEDLAGNDGAVEEDLLNDSTQVISLEELKREVESDLIASEKDLKKEAAEYIKKSELEKQNEIEKEEQDLEDDAEAEEEITKERKRKKKIIYALLGLLLAVFLFSDNEEPANEQQFKVIYPRIIFPQQYDVPDDTKANTLYQEGMLKLSEGNYSSTLDAAEFFRASAENKFRENNAVGRLIFVYSELLQHSANYEGDVSSLFKLVQVFNSQMMENPYLAAGIANFYLRTGKNEAVIKLIERFTTLQRSQPSKELFAVYLNALMYKGDLIKARQVRDLFNESDMKDFYIAKSLINYYESINERDKKHELLKQSMAIFPESVELVLIHAEDLYESQEYGQLRIDLEFVREKLAYGSKVFYSKFLELTGLLLADEDASPEIVLEYFQKALEYNESSELRSKLASLDSNSTKEINRLINHSKAIRLIDNSKNHLSNNNYRFAFRDALEATRVAPDYVAAQLHLVDLQLRQSYFSQAIQILEDLYDKDPHNPEVIFALIDGYISAYMFSKAQSLLSIIGATDLRTMPDFYAKTAKYYIYKNQVPHAISWLQRAINIDPLNDELNYELAKILIRHKQFNQAKVVLNKVMDIDPANVDYRISYAEILYESESANSAIGYLYNVLEDFKDNPKILSSIGIYYYRTGQIKMFQSIKDRLEKLPNRDGALFEFLISAAKMDQRFDRVIEYSQKLVEINPGDLEARLFLGRVYMEKSMYKEALAQFEEIKSRLETYPKLQYYISRLFLLTDDIDRAVELAKKEVEGNPSSVDGYVLLGEIYTKEEKFNEAEEQFKKAQKIDETNIDVLNGLAYIHFKKSQYEIALDLYKKSKQIEPSLAETYRYLGDVYRNVGQSSLAIEEYEMYLELSPNSSYKENLQSYIRMMK